MNNSFSTRRGNGGREGSRQNFRRGSTRNRPAGQRRSGANQGKRFAGQTISHDKLINKNPVTKAEESYTPEHSFADFGFHSQIVANLIRKGYQTPTRVQDQSIPPILAGRDLLGLANTGSGKTAAFVLPIIHKLNSKPGPGGVLIITPTRELAQQIQDEFRQFADRLRVSSVLCVGGLNIRQQIKELRRRPPVVIGTPGRLKDLINQGELKLQHTNTLVLDEMDRMLDMGFLPDIRAITSELPEKRQSLCFGATITPEISKLLTQILKDPVEVSVRTSETGEHIAQDIVKAQGQEAKMKQLIEMLSRENFEKVLIFGQMKHSVQKLADTLSKRGFRAEAIHGNKSQPQRQRALSSFKKGRVNILVATDVAARGLDVPNVSQVINFDLPSTHEEYIHRIGRTGRAGKPGQAYTFV